MQVLDLLPGTYDVIDVVRDVRTVEGEEVEEGVKAKVLKNIETMMRREQIWVESGQRLVVAKEETEDGVSWVMTLAQGGKQRSMGLRRRKWGLGGNEWLAEPVFEGGRLRNTAEAEFWRKMVESSMFLARQDPGV